MLHETEFYKAHHYFLVPMKELAKPEKGKIDEDDVLITEMEKYAVLVGGVGIMLEAARFLDDDDIVFEMGLAGLRCMLGVELTSDEALDLVSKARKAFDERVKKNENNKKD